MTLEAAEQAAPEARLDQIATEVGDAWLRCRGPLTGLKALVAARDEAVRLGAGEDYLGSFGLIVGAAKALQGSTPNRSLVDARKVLEREIPRLRAASSAARVTQ